MNHYFTKALVLIAFLVTTSQASAAVWSPLDPSMTPFSYSPNPADAIWYYDDNLTPQNDASIRAEVETVFGLTAGTLSSVSQCDSATSACTGASATQFSASGSTTNTYSSIAGFNYLAIHFGQSELVFHWINPINEFTFTDLDGKDGFVKGLSNYRAYSDNVSAVPVPAAAWLFASGLGFFGVARRRISK